MSELNYQTLWEETIKCLKKELSQLEFSSWIALLHYEKVEEGKIVLAVASKFHRDQILQKYSTKIEHILFYLSSEEIKIQINVDPSLIKDNTDEVNKEDDSYEKEKRVQHPDLNETYTFDNFVIGSGNQFAANAAIAIAKNPSNSYNPFFIHGGVGLGKTHLLQAIGNYIWKSSKLKILYVTAETFVSEFIQAVNSPIKSTVPMASFKKKYRNTDVLLIDDIQLLEGKIESQEEIHHTFNQLYQNKKQMVFASDRPPSELKLQDRLKSRFQNGLVVDVRMPEYETRFAILNKKNEANKIKIDKSIIDFIAKNVSSSVRDLEAMLTKAVAFTECTQKPLVLETAKQLLINDIRAKNHTSINVSLIIKIVAEYFNLSQDDIKSKKKSKTIVLPRHIAMYLAREMTEHSSTELGFAFGGKDHTAILSACKKVEERMLSEPSIQTAVSVLRDKIRGENDSE